MSSSGTKERNLDAGRTFRTFEMKRNLNFDHDKANLVNVQANPQINNRTSESSGLLESSSVFDKESRPQTSTGTPQSSRNNTKSYSITETASKRQSCTENQIATIESTLHHLLKSQSSIGVILNTLIYNFQDFVVQFQTKQSGSKFAEQPNVSNTSISYQKSNNHAPASCSLDVSFPKIEATLKNLLSQIELVAKETTSKLDQYEIFLRSRDEKSILEANGGEELVENKIQSQLFKHNACSWTVIKTPDKRSDPLQTKDIKRPSQNFAKNENTGNSLISFPKNSEILNAIEIVSDARDNVLDSKKSVVHQTPIRQSNRGESARIFSQQASDLPQAPLGLRSSATFGALNLPEKTESILTQPMQLTTKFPNTTKESLSQAVKLRQMESNRSKKADLDLAISKRQDESKLGQTSVFIKKDRSEMIIHTARDQILESNYFNTKDIATGILSSPCNDRETGNFTSRTIPNDFHITPHVIRKLKIKPGMNELPQKDLSELSFPDDSDENSPNELDPEENQKKNSNIEQPATEEFLNSIAKKEKTIIKSLMKAQYGQDHPSYHKAEQGRMLQRKYLISSKWWCRWKEFVNFDAKETANNEKTANLFKSHVYKRPGSITNRDLVTEENIKDLQSLEYDLDLKPNLLEHHDFEAVNKEIFEIFVTWYGCDYEIYRVLRPDPFHDNKLFLDLYPKKKFKRNQHSKSTGHTRSKVENTGL